MYGQESPFLNAGFLFDGTPIEVPQEKTLALHWDFAQVTGSDNGSGTGPSNSYDGKFLVVDVSSGSVDNKYGEIGTIVNYSHTGMGDFFFRNNTEMVENAYISIAKHRLPENIADSDLVSILREDEQIFTRDTQPVNFHFALEKSMYQTISEEMIGFFGTKAINGANGLFYHGGWHLLGIQTICVLAAVIYSFVATYIIAFVMDKTIGLRISQEQEYQGMDLSLHSETAYETVAGGLR